ncbi:unnamed protein product [Coregonus sp. 'balchen']|nr:unnamed protein product [Coregonus sp. 'balchen']
MPEATMKGDHLFSNLRNATFYQRVYLLGGEELLVLQSTVGHPALGDSFHQITDFNDLPTSLFACNVDQSVFEDQEGKACYVIQFPAEVNSPRSSPNTCSILLPCPVPNFNPKPNPSYSSLIPSPNPIPLPQPQQPHTQPPCPSPNPSSLIPSPSPNPLPAPTPSQPPAPASTPAASYPAPCPSLNPSSLIPNPNPLPAPYPSPNPSSLIPSPNPLPAPCTSPSPSLRQSEKRH